MRDNIQESADHSVNQLRSSPDVTSVHSCFQNLMQLLIDNVWGKLLNKNSALATSSSLCYFSNKI